MKNIFKIFLVSLLVFSFLFSFVKAEIQTGIETIQNNGTSEYPTEKDIPSVNSESISPEGEIYPTSTTLPDSDYIDEGEIPVTNTGINIGDYKPMPLPQPRESEDFVSKQILKIGEGIRLSETLGIKLLKLPAEECIDIRERCDFFAEIEVQDREQKRIIQVYRNSYTNLSGILFISFVGVLDSETGVFYIKSIPSGDSGWMPMPIPTPAEPMGDDYSLKIGESINLVNNTVQMRLLELTEDPNCLELEICNNFAKIELRISRSETKTISINQNSFHVEHLFAGNLLRGKLIINFIGRGEDELTGLFNIHFDTQKPTPSEYEIIDSSSGEIEDSVFVSPEKVYLYDEGRETGMALPASRVNMINAVRVNIGEEIAESKELFIKPIGERIVLEVVKGMVSENCEEYLSECEEGNEEFCQKWNLNCKREEINIETCRELLSTCQLGILGNCREYNNSCQQNEILTASTKEEIKVKDNKVFINEREVKIMPDVASEKAIETLELKRELEIELKDTGKPTYEILGEKEVRVLGLFRARMNITTEIDAETGEIEIIKRPWWRFLVF